VLCLGYYSDPNPHFDSHHVEDLKDYKIPVILGAPPLSESMAAKGKRVFYNGKIDREGPACLPSNPAKTCIKRQVGGGKQPATKAIEDSNIESLSDMVPTPTPMQPRATKRKGVKGSVTDAVEDRNLPSPIPLPKAALGQKRVEVIIITSQKVPHKLTTSRLTMITISSGSDDSPKDTHAGNRHKKSSVGCSEACSSEEQDPSTHKRKVKGPDSPHAMKRATPDRPSNQLSKSKGTHKSFQTRQVTKKTRFRILSLLDTESSDEGKLTIVNPKDHGFQTSMTAGAKDIQPATIPQCDKPSGCLCHDTRKLWYT